MKILLADNDYIHKLAACDLLQETLQVLKFVATDVYVLPTARYKFKQTFRKSPDNPVYARLMDFLDSVNELNHDEFPEVSQFTKLKDIDAGEAVLLAMTVEFEDFLLATGDKRFLWSVSTAKGINEIQKRIQGKVISLEQTILYLINNLGFSCITEKIRLACYCDTVLQAIFGGKPKEKHVRDGLQSYIDKLQKDTGLLIERE